MRKLVLLLAVVTAAVGIWVMIRAARPVDVPVGFVEDARSDISNPGAMLSGGEAAEEKTFEVADLGLERAEVPITETITGAEPQGLHILVVEKATGAPVPGAEVAYVGGLSARYNDMTPREREEYSQLSRDSEKLTHHYGTSVVADSDGVVFAPVAERGTYLEIVGRLGQLYGELRIILDARDDVGGQEFVLEMERDLTLTVQVLDSRGNPAVDVPIAIASEGWEQSNFGFFQVATTEATGLARIPHLQITVRERKRRGQASTSYWARPHIPGLIDAGESFNAENPPEGPVVLQLPATGRVVVETTDIEGRRRPLELGNVNLAIAPLTSPDDPADLSPLVRQWYAKPSTDGTAVFKWVVTGKTYEVIATVSMEGVREVFPGPIAEGHEVRVTLTPKRESYRVVGRVVDERLDPVRNTRFRAPYETSGGVQRTRSFTTDDEGRFVFVIGRENQEVTLTKLTIQPGSISGSLGQNTGIYRMQGTRLLSLGKNDLGDVVLGSSPVMATGQILVDGQVPQARQFALQVELLETEQLRPGNPEPWRSDRNLVVTFSGEGRFEIRGISRPTRYRVSMSRGGLGRGGQMDFLPVDPVEFAPGQKDLKIELQSGGSLQASVLVDETLSLMNLWVRLEPPAGAEKDPDVNRLPIFLSNRLYGQHREEHEGLQVFRWGALWPGVYRLEILPRGSRTPVVTVEDIQIVPGERTRDPRLDGIDLRGRFRSIQILIQDENGRQMKGASLGAMVFINESLFETEAHAFTADSGIASVVTGDPQVDLLVTARGYQPRALFGVSEDTTVSLEPYPEVLVRIAGGAPELPEGNELRVALTKRGRQRDDRMFVSATSMSPMVDFYFHPRTIPEAVDDRGEITLQVEDDGTYSLAVSVRNNVLRQTATVRDVVPSELQVQTAAGRQVFEVRISAESLKQALAEVGGR